MYYSWGGICCWKNWHQILVVLFTDVFLNLFTKLREYHWPVIIWITLLKAGINGNKLLFTIKVYKLWSELFVMKFHMFGKTLYNECPNMVRWKAKRIVKWVSNPDCRKESMFHFRVNQLTVIITSFNLFH